MSDGLATSVLDIFVPALDRAMTIVDQTEATERIERTALAVAGYQREHGEYPASLDELVAEWMDAVPVDIFDEAGGPLRYAVEDERVVVYSVGSNGEDNGGLDDRDEGDIVIEWQR